MDFWTRTLERFRAGRRATRRRVEEPKRKAFVWPLAHKAYAKHSHARENARRRRQIAKGILRP